MSFHFHYEVFDFKKKKNLKYDEERVYFEKKLIFPDAFLQKWEVGKHTNSSRPSCYNSIIQTWIIMDGLWYQLNHRKLCWQHPIIKDSNLGLLYEIFYKIAFLEIISKYACFISVILGNFFELIWWTYFWKYCQNQRETPIRLSKYIWQLLLRFSKSRLICSVGINVLSFWIKFMLFS